MPGNRWGKEKKSSELCVLMTLWFLSNKEPHRTLCNLFNMSLASIFRIIRRVIHWLVTLVPHVIKWPEGNQLVKISRGFEEKAGITNCIGAIDGSHISINKPERYSRKFFNRKQNYSILLQAVCDSDMKFLNIYCGDPGSFHDSRMLRRSQLFHIAERNKRTLFPNNSFLLGDKGYNGIARKWIVSPFKDDGNLTVEQVRFNSQVTITRVSIERAFGILKARFRQLHKLPLRKTKFMTKVIVASCVLHNLCLENEDDGADFYYENPVAEEQEENNNNEQINEIVEDGDDRRMLLFREMYPL